MSGHRLSVFPFFCGMGRSGTTLLRAMFDSHPDVAVPGESQFIMPMAARRRRYETPSGFAADAFLRDLAGQERFRMWGVPEGAVRSVMVESGTASFADAVRSAFAAFARAHGKPRYADKTPAHIRHLPLLAELFPESRFVHIIRDGRDVALSLMERTEGAIGLDSVAIRWREMVVRGRRDGRVLGRRRYLEVRYEDLVEDPEGTVRSVCDFLELAFDESMLRYFERAEEVVRLTHNPEIHRSIFLPPTKGLRDWRRDMPREEVAVFEALAGRVLTDLGYERLVPRPSVMIRVAVRWRRAGSTGRRIVRGVGRRLGLRAGGKRGAVAPQDLRTG